MKSRKIRNSQQSANYSPSPIIKKRKYTSMYGQMFMEDFCRGFSIILRRKGEYRHFYKIDAPDKCLEEFLEFDDYMFLEYDLDKLLSQNLEDLIERGKAYVEVDKLFDEDNKLVGIKFVPFKNNFQIRFAKKVYYLLRTSDKRLIKGKIDLDNIIGFKLQDFGYSKRHFRTLFKRLHKFDYLLTGMPIKPNSGFDFEVYNEKKDFKLLKFGHAVRWMGRNFDNRYVSDPYLLYLKMEELKLKEDILNKLLKKYNDKLAQLGKAYSFSGKITFESKGINYDELYEDLLKGKKTCEQVSNELYK